uniref:Uncharacterized protein LOC104210702 n=1 Tax=Nicotiana sylvestris TaxID=4096 RepID=A0A1U7V6U2_NICSY|nr:PREDICTED: uncharacterized protein LOC104210702 [Nicotiana sylvestris]
MDATRKTVKISVQKQPYKHKGVEGLSSTRTLLADASDATPISSPLTPLLTSNTGNKEAEKATSKPSTFQAILKGIKQSTTFSVIGISFEIVGLLLANRTTVRTITVVVQQLYVAAEQLNSCWDNQCIVFS